MTRTEVWLCMFASSALGFLILDISAQISVSSVIHGGGYLFAHWLSSRILGKE